MLTKEEIERVLNDKSITIGEYCVKNNISRMKFYRYAKKYSITTKKISCGRSKEYLRTGYNDLTGTYWSNLKNGAKNRNKEFTISIEYAYNLIQLQKYKCNLSGLHIDFKQNTASLDRIDSTKGYIEGNVQWLHKDINTMKWVFTQDQFLNYCRIIVENNKVDDEQQ